MGKSDCGAQRLSDQSPAAAPRKFSFLGDGLEVEVEVTQSILLYYIIYTIINTDIQTERVQSGTIIYRDTIMYVHYYCKLHFLYSCLKKHFFMSKKQERN